MTKEVFEEGLELKNAWHKNRESAMAGSHWRAFNDWVCDNGDALFKSISDKRQDQRIVGAFQIAAGMVQGDIFSSKNGFTYTEYCEAIAENSLRISDTIIAAAGEGKV